MVKRKKYVIGLIIMFIIGCLLASGIYAYASSVKFKMSIQLSPTIYFTMHLNKFTDTNDNNILDNTESKTLNSDVCIFSNVDSVTANSSYARVNGLTITIILNDDLKLQNETEKYILTVTNYNNGKYVLFEMLTSDNNAFETTPTTLKNIAVPNGQNYYNKSMVIESKALQEVNYMFNVYAEIYDTAIVEHTVNNGSYNVAYVGEDYEVDLTPSNSNMCVVVDSVKLGETALNVNTDYNFDQVTNVLTIYKESLNANNNNNITITTTEKPKFVSTTLTLDGCSAVRNGAFYSDGVSAVINGTTTQSDLVIKLTETDMDYLRWEFDIKINGVSLTSNQYSWNEENKILTIPHALIKEDVLINAKAGLWYWEGGIATSFAGGNGSESSPFLIENADQLALLADLTNNHNEESSYNGIVTGLTFATAYYELTHNIYLNDETFTFDEDSGLVKVTDGTNICYIGSGWAGDESGTNTTFDETASEMGAYYTNPDSATTSESLGAAYGGEIYTWTPIGYAITNDYEDLYAFKGKFNGRGFTVSGNFVNNLEAVRIGVFGHANNSDGSIKNVSAENFLHCIWRYSGGVGGTLWTNLENLSSNGIIISYGSWVGGIIGTNICDMSNCINYSTIIGQLDKIGGICGSFSYQHNATMSGCVNYGNIYSTAGSCGGIVGYNHRYIQEDSSVIGGTITDCINYGNVISLSGGAVAGVCGYNAYAIKDCINYGNVISLSGTAVAGVCGHNQYKLQSCENYGAVTATDKYCGGIVGCNHAGTVSNCINSGNVFSTAREVGGIVGLNDMYTLADSTIIRGTIANCINYGNVEAHDIYAGGICGLNNYQIKECINYGDIDCKVHQLGGIAGYQGGQDSIIANCYNYGTIGVKYTDLFARGGIVGDLAAYSATHGGTVYNCGNFGDVYGDYSVGGICAHANKSAVIEKCFNVGTVTGREAVGGIAARLGYDGASTIRNCVNVGKINPGVRGGGILGLSYNGEVSNCYNIGSIISAQNGEYGAIVGCNTPATFTNNYYLSGSAIAAGVDKNAVNGATVTGATTFTSDMAVVLFDNPENTTPTVTVSNVSTFINRVGLPQNSGNMYLFTFDSAGALELNGVKYTSGFFNSWLGLNVPEGYTPQAGWQIAVFAVNV